MMKTSDFTVFGVMLLLAMISVWSIDAAIQAFGKAPPEPEAQIESVTYGGEPVVFIVQ